jgi:hypothetical protein
MVRWAIIDDADPRLVNTGKWNFLQSPISEKTPEYSGTVHTTNDPTTTVSFNFTDPSFADSLPSWAKH